MSIRLGLKLIGQGILTLATAGFLAFIIGCVKRGLWILAAWGIRLFNIYLRITWHVLPYSVVYDALEVMRRLYYILAPLYQGSVYDAWRPPC